MNDPENTTEPHFDAMREIILHTSDLRTLEKIHRELEILSDITTGQIFKQSNVDDD